MKEKETESIDQKEMKDLPVLSSVWDFIRYRFEQIKYWPMV